MIRHWAGRPLCFSGQANDGHHAFVSGWPGDLRPSKLNFVFSFERSDSDEAEAIRLRSFKIFSLRARRRRISGRRLGADISDFLD